MDRSPFLPPAPRVHTEAQPSALFPFADPETFMEMVRRFTGQAAPTNAAAAAQRGGIVPTSALEPVQQRLPLLGTAATAPGPRAAGLRLTLSLALWSDNPGPCILNKAPDPLLLETSDAEEVEMEDANEVEMEDAEELEAISEGRFYLLPSPPPGRNADTGELKLLILFPLGSSSNEEN